MSLAQLSNSFAASLSAQSHLVVAEAEFGQHSQISSPSAEHVSTRPPQSSSRKPSTLAEKVLEKVVQFDVTHFAISIAFAAFAAMWKSVSMNYERLSVPKEAFAILWFIALLALAVTVSIYVARIIMWPGSLRFDFSNPKMVNFFYSPVIIGCLMVIGAPSFVMNTLARTIAFYILLAYQAGLSVYLYGEWLFGSVLIDVMHPVVFMQVIGYFLLANLAASLFLVELALASVSIGALYWILIFVSNFQHTSTALRMQMEKPQPTFFMFIAPPAQAAIALYFIAAARDGGGGLRSASGLLVVPANVQWPVAALVPLYIDLFIYAIIFRIFPSFWQNRFAIAWWAYIFPLSAAAAATCLRSRGESSPMFWSVLSGILVTIATIAMLVVSCATIWGVQGGQLPKNERALNAYQEQVFRNEVAQTEISVDV